MDQLIERMDLNQDGHIAWDEFSSALVDWKMVGPPLPAEIFLASRRVMHRCTWDLVQAIMGGSWLILAVHKALLPVLGYPAVTALFRGGSTRLLDVLPWRFAT